MNARPELADRLALAIVEHGPTSGNELAKLVETRKATVLLALRSTPRFECAGSGSTSVWQLAGTGWEPAHRTGRVEVDYDTALIVLDRLTALEAQLAEVVARLDAVEQWLAERHSQRAVAGALGTSKTTVHRDLEHEGEQLVTCDQLTDRVDGLDEVRVE